MKFRSVTAAGAAAALTAGLISIASPAVAAAAKPGDFDGDGRRDTALGSPDGAVGEAAKAGFVTVVYGGATGPDPARRQVLSQGGGGVPGNATGGNAFGKSLSSADYDGDGYADLAVGSPGEAVDGKSDAGTVTVIFGSASGLSGRAVRLTSGEPQQGGELGGSVQSADLTGDGHGDVAAGQGRSGFWIFNKVHEGGTGGTRVALDDDNFYDEELTLTAADFTGDGRTDVAAGWVENLDGLPGGRTDIYGNTGTGVKLIQSYSGGGPEGAAGDINGDGHADLVTRLRTVEGPETDGGAINVAYGSPSGLDGDKRFTQGTAGVPGTPEQDDNWGAALAVGDANGDGKADVAVGAPRENIGNISDAGAVTVLFGSSSGLSTAGARQIGQDTSGVPGNAEAGDHFGYGVSLLEATGDGKADLLAGSPGENGTEGAIWVLPAAAVPGVQAFNSGTLGVPGRNAALTRVFSR